MNVLRHIGRRPVYVIDVARLDVLVKNTASYQAFFQIILCNWL